MFNGPNPTLNSDLAPVSTKVKTLLYLVGQKARESSDTIMSTCDGVRHIPGHWKINKTLALLLLIRGCQCVFGSGGGTGGPDPPLENHKNIGFLAILVPIPLKSLSYQASFQGWGIIDTAAKRHLNGVSLAGRRWSANCGIWIIPPPSN